MKKILKQLCVLLVSILIMLNFTACNMWKSDEELITDRFNMFVLAYNNGDMDAVIECLDTKSQNIINATINIGEGVFSGLTGFDLSSEDLFALGMGFMSEDPLSVQISSIEITSETSAIVNLTMSLKEENMGVEETESGVLKMVKEKGDWYIDLSEEFSSMY